MPHIRNDMDPAPAPTTTSTTRPGRPTYHFVCCDAAYCQAPVEADPNPAVTPDDRPCDECTDLALRAHCPTCNQLYP